MMPFRSYRIYAAKKRRLAQRVNDMNFQINMARKYREIQLELNRAFSTMCITSTHELTMLMITQNLPKLGPDPPFHRFSLAISPSAYTMDSHAGLILCLEVELLRHRITNTLMRECQKFSFPYDTNKQASPEAIEPWI